MEQAASLSARKAPSFSGEVEAIEVDGEAASCVSSAAEEADAEGEASLQEEKENPFVLLPTLLEARRRVLRAVLESSEDAVCALAVHCPSSCADGEAQAVAALGACDDCCHLFDLTPVFKGENAPLKKEALQQQLLDGQEEPDAETHTPHLAARRLVGASDSVSCVAFSSDGAFLAAGSFDGACRVYRLFKDAEASSAAGLVGVLRGSSGGIASVAFHPRGAALLAATEDNTAWLWIFPSLWSKAPEADAAAARACAEASRVFGGGKSFHSEENPETAVLKAAALRGEASVLSVFVGPSPLTECAFTSSLPTKCLVGAQCGSVCLYSPKDGRASLSFSHPRKEPLAREVWGGAVVSSREAATDAEDAALAVVSLLVDSERHCVNVGFEDGCLLVFSEQTGRPLFATQAHEGSVESLANVSSLHPLAVATKASSASAPHWVLSSGLDGFVRLWCVSRRNARLQIDCRQLPVSFLTAPPTLPTSAASTTSRAAATEDLEATVASARKKGEEKSGGCEGATRVLLHPKLPLAAVSSSWGVCRLCDLKTQKVVAAWSAHATPVMEFSQIRDEATSWTLLSADAEGSAALWQFTAQELARALSQ